MQLPFVVGRPVSGEHFIDREEEFRIFDEMLKAGQSVALISPRRFGKTSLLLLVLERLKKEGYLTGMIDCSRAIDTEDLAKRITSEVLKNESTAIRLLRSTWEGVTSLVVRNLKKLDATLASILEVHLEFQERRLDDRKLLEESLDFIEKYAKSKRKRMVFVFDELSDLYERDGKLLKLMRSVMQTHDSVAYVISGGQEATMSFITSSKQSPFYLFFEHVPLGKLPDEEVFRYIKRRLKKFNVEAEDRAINLIIQLTGCHPDYMQRLALTAYHLAGKELNENTVRRAYDLMLEEIGNVFEERWRSFAGAPLQAKILQAIASGENPYSLRASRALVSRMLGELIRKGHLRRRERGKYEFIDPLFKKWLTES